MTGWCHPHLSNSHHSYGPNNSPPVEGCQAPPDGVVFPSPGGDNSPPVEGCQAPLDGVVSSYLHKAIPLLRRGVKLRLTGWYSPPVEGCQAPPDGVVVWVLHQLIPLPWRGVKLRLTGWYSPPLEGCQAPLDGVVYNRLHPPTPQTIAANSPPAEGCQAPLDGVVYNRLRPQIPQTATAIPFLWRGVKLRLTGWCPRICIIFPKSAPTMSDPCTNPTTSRQCVMASYRIVHYSRSCDRIRVPRQTIKEVNRNE